MKFYRMIRALVVVLMAVESMSACSYPGELSGSIMFQFNLRQDNQHAAIVDYKLWGDDYVMVRAPEAYVKRGQDFYYEGTQGPNKKLEYLYVKWRDIPSGKIYEKTVDLREALPSDIDNGIIYLMIYGGDLYVYLALHKPLPPNEKPIGAPLYGQRVNLQIYPKK
jgi:hypothetical protein